jgi:hypothetical protein
MLAGSARDGVPTNNAPSAPTDAITLPERVANTMRFGVSSVMATDSWALIGLVLSPKTRRASGIVVQRFE